jgi:hypothetical protein
MGAWGGGDKVRACSKKRGGTISLEKKGGLVFFCLGVKERAHDSQGCGKSFFLLLPFLFEKRLESFNLICSCTIVFILLEEVSAPPPYERSVPHFIVSEWW